MILILSVTGCKYEVAEPPWEQDLVNTPVPVITEIQPADVAPAGINTITIVGENFAETVEDNKVYFDNVNTEIIAASTNSITVYRPNLVSDSSTIWVVSYNAIVTAKYTPYKIDPVMERYGEFLDNYQLTGLAVDDEENLYVLQSLENKIYKVPPGEAKIYIGSTSGIPYDITMAPDGKPVVALNQTYLNKFDMETGEDTLFVNVPKKVSFCDYDDYGMLYVIGRKSDLIVVSPDGSNRSIGVYTDYIISGMRVYNNYVYIVGENTKAGAEEAEFGIWRHQILDNNGNLGNQELMLDWATTGEVYADSKPSGVAVTQDGTMYVGCNNGNPILIVTPEKQIDILYKDIIPAYAVKLIGGPSHFIYMLLGTQEYNIVRIDIGNK